MTVEAILVVIMLASGVFGLWVDQRDLARERELREQAAICAEATGAGDAMSIDCSAPADRARDVDEAGASSRAEKVQPEEGHQVALPGRGENEPPSLVSPSTPVVRMPAHPAERSHSPEAFKFNVSDFPFSWYVELVRRRITEKWSPPGRAGRAVVIFEIGRNGEVPWPKVESSSGDRVYDQAAMRAVTEATPFPPLPEGFKESVLLIHLGFEVTSEGE